MKAASIESVGAPDVIEFGDVAEPIMDRHQVLIRVHAASVNPIDTYVRSGVVAFDLPQPFFPGCDAAGIVEAVGDQVHGISVGDRVWCTNQGLQGRQGTLAEKIAIDSHACYPLPDSVSFVNGAATALVAVTAHLGLFREAQLEAGETILVIGGAGGVGSMVVQMAKAAGATVIATAGSPEKAQCVHQMGADHVIEYRRQSIEEMTRQYAPRGVQVFWETRREPDFDMAIELMAPRGRMVLMAGREARPAFPVGPFYVKECSLHGFAMFKATPVEMRAAANDINTAMAQGKLTPHIGATFTLDQAAEAHRLQESATLHGSASLIGKIVITM